MMEIEDLRPKGNDRVTPEKLIKILKKHGEEISLEESKKVLDLMHFFANLAVNQIIKSDGSS